MHCSLTLSFRFSTWPSRRFLENRWVLTFIFRHSRQTHRFWWSQHPILRRISNHRIALAFQSLTFLKINFLIYSREDSTFWIFSSPSFWHLIYHTFFLQYKYTHWIIRPSFLQLEIHNPFSFSVAEKKLLPGYTGHIWIGKLLLRLCRAQHMKLRQRSTWKGSIF